jgi:hypothetical protein
LPGGIRRRTPRQNFRAGVTLVFAQRFLRHVNDLIGMTRQGPEKPYATGIFGDAEANINSSLARARNTTRVPRFCATHQHLGKNLFHVGAAAMTDISRHAA